MSTVVAAAIALFVGLAVGVLLGRRRRAALARRVPSGPSNMSPMPHGLGDDDAPSEETRPTLVPFRAVREAGIARAVDRASPEDPDQLDELLAELDRKGR